MHFQGTANHELPGFVSTGTSICGEYLLFLHERLHSGEYIIDICRNRIHL